MWASVVSLVITIQKATTNEFFKCCNSGSPKFNKVRTYNFDSSNYDFPTLRDVIASKWIFTLPNLEPWCRHWSATSSIILPTAITPRIPCCTAWSCSWWGWPPRPPRPWPPPGHPRRPSAAPCTSSCCWAICSWSTRSRWPVCRGRAVPKSSPNLLCLMKADRRMTNFESCKQATFLTRFHFLSSNNTAAVWPFPSPLLTFITMGGLEIIADC